MKSSIGYLYEKSKHGELIAPEAAENLLQEKFKIAIGEKDPPAKTFLLTSFLKEKIIFIIPALCSFLILWFTNLALKSGTRIYQFNFTIFIICTAILLLTFAIQYIKKSNLVFSLITSLMIALLPVLWITQNNNYVTTKVKNFAFEKNIKVHHQQNIILNNKTTIIGKGTLVIKAGSKNSFAIKNPNGVFKVDNNHLNLSIIHKKIKIKFMGTKAFFSFSKDSVKVLLWQGALSIINNNKTNFLTQDNHNSLNLKDNKITIFHQALPKWSNDLQKYENIFQNQNKIKPKKMSRRNKVVTNISFKVGSCVYYYRGNERLNGIIDKKVNNDFTIKRQGIREMKNFKQNEIFLRNCN